MKKPPAASIRTIVKDIINNIQQRVGETVMDRLLELEFEFVLFSDLSERQHRQQAEEVHMAAVKWAEERSLGIGGGLRVQCMKGGAFSRHRFGLCTTLDNQFVDFQHAQSLFAHLRSMAHATGCELVGGYHVFPEEEG